MKTDILKQYVSLRSALEREKLQLQARLEEVTRALGANGLDLGPAAAATPVQGRGMRTMSAAARARIAAAQRARWARVKSGTPKSAAPAKGRRRMSPAARAKLAAIARARWARAKASGKSAL